MSDTFYLVRALADDGD